MRKEPDNTWWRYGDDGNSEWAWINYMNCQARVQDCDGDYVVWEVTDPECQIVEKGEIWPDEFIPDEFALGKEKALEAMIKLIREIRKKENESPS